MVDKPKKPKKPKKKDMALTDNRTQLQDCEAVGDVAGDSTADPQSNTSEAGVVIQGTNALQFQVTNAQEYLAYDLDSAGSTFNLDLSDSTSWSISTTKDLITGALSIPLAQALRCRTRTST